MRILKAAFAVTSLVLVACGPQVDVTGEGPVQLAASQNFLRVEKAIPNEYIVVLKDAGPGMNVRGVAEEHAARYGGGVFHVYEHALKGYAIRMNEAQALALANNPQVAYVEENGLVTVSGSQSGATWGIDRIDQRDLPLNSTYNYNNDGSGVNAYIIDTGIRRTHSEFGGRAYLGTDTVGDGQNGNDCHGHGTHVAGTVGGSTYGVAKNVRLYAVRVLNCQGSGTNAGVIQGVDWVTANHVKPAVANMSLGGSADQALDDAVTNAIAAGVTFAVAAGNDNANACNYSPARTPNAITAGATTNTDARASYSNYGSCLDIFAPGSSITSSWNTSDTATNTISGTSMASPHVAGAAALYLAANPSATPAQVRDALVNNGSLNKVTSAGTGSPNVLLYTAFIGGGGGGGDTTPPTTSITAPTGGSTVSGTITISADASDNVGVTRVEFFYGSTLIGTDTASPYSVSWNTTSVANGGYILTSKAYDAAGNVGTSAGVSVTVSNAGGSCSTSSQLFANPGFESGPVSWTTTAFVIDNSTSYPARTGSWKAWMNGYGMPYTDTVYQQITIPAAACSAQLSFWLRVDSAETTTTTAYDKLTVTVQNSSGTVLATLATYSNLNEGPSYVQKTFDLAAYKGQTIRIHFNGTEDFLYETSFLIDDAAVNITQ